jgi:signal transduction histidine kinase
MEESKSFYIDDPDPVPLAARTQTPIVHNEIGMNDKQTRNLLFPETRSEAALPILFGGDVIGVLDLQSRKENRFSDEDIVLYASYANQIAVAIRNAILFEELLVAKEQAEQAEQVKSSFLATMSHELRSPLNTIITFSKFLHREIPGSLNAEQKQLIGAVADSGQLLLNLINDILDMSKIEAGLLTLYVEENIDIREILHNAIECASSILIDKPVTIHEDIPQDLPLINGDQKRLLQIFLNILSNACKFTQKGYIRVSASTVENHLLVSVEDTGVGIAPEDYECVFAPFQQTTSGNDTRVGQV